MKNEIALLATLVLASPASAQTSAAPAAAPCSSPENRALDFWVGDWTAKWELQGKKGTGTNRITRDEFGSCVITEHFKMDDGSLNGLSISTYRPGIKQWRQTWVDDQGGYFDLFGGPVTGNDQSFYFENKRPSDAVPFVRMIFQDVKPNSFTWRWQRRAKESEAWSDLWVINYQRKSGATASAGVVVDGYEQLTVGDTRIDARKLKSYGGKWRVLEKRLDGSTVETERSSETFALVRKNGRPVWRQIQHETFGNTGTSDMVVLTEARSFAPVVAEQKDVRDGSLKRITYSGREIGIECGGHLCPPTIRAPAKGTVYNAVTTDAAPFDYFGGTYGLLFAALPLKVGAKFLVPVFSPAQGLIWLRVDVTGTERVGMGGERTTKAFRVVTPQNGWIYHISKTAPYWLRLEYKMRNGVVQVTERV